MVANEYKSKVLFPYARGMYWIFPAGFKRDPGKGSVHETKDYTIYFKPDTPEDIKLRVINDYAKYHKNHKSGVD